MTPDVMGYFNRKTKRLTPCELRRPADRGQAIWGLRHDPAQVKLYIKGNDMHRPLPWLERVARTEVRLSGAGLAVHELQVLSDLAHFNFRKRLSPYLRLMRGSRRRWRGMVDNPSLLAIIRRRQEQLDHERWETVGAPGFRATVDKNLIVMKRAQDANERVGNSLDRLSRRFRDAEF